jgi:DnaJ domain
MNNSSSSQRRTFYDVLQVDPSATASEIRKAYLKKSLQYHPDKNPADPELAKAKFVEIGAAYETLSDPVQRRQYDQELRSGRRTSFATSNNHGTGDDAGSHFDNFAPFSEQRYDTYRDIFDATVAGMSEEELAAAVGTVAALAGFVGSMIGSRIMNNKSRGARSANGSGGSSVLSVAGSMIGSVVASEIAASGVRAIHQESLQRIAYKEECRRAVARGAPMPEPPRKTNLGDVLQRTFDSVLNASPGSSMGDNQHRDNGYQNGQGETRD